jgi:hypothetical protein
MSDEVEHGPFNGFRVDVEHITSGQPRPYADSIYEAELRFTNWWRSLTGPRKGTWEPKESDVRELARILVHPFEDQPTFGSAHLKSLTREAPQTWRVLIVDPYLD